MKFYAVFCFIFIVPLESTLTTVECPIGQNKVTTCPRPVEQTCRNQNLGDAEGSCDPSVHSCQCGVGTLRKDDGTCVVPEECFNQEQRAALYDV